MWAHDIQVSAIEFISELSTTEKKEAALARCLKLLALVAEMQVTKYCFPFMKKI